MNYYVICAFVVALVSASSSSEAAKPSDVLQEKENFKVVRGVNVRKGTVAATIQNISILNNLMLNNGDEKEIAQLVEEQRPLCKGLWAIGLTEVQPIPLWINDPNQPGRTLVAVIMLQECPQLITKEVREYLQKIRAKQHSSLQAEIDKVL